MQHFALPPERMLAEGYGESRPIAPNDTSRGRSQNRRVQVVNPRHEMSEAMGLPAALGYPPDRAARAGGRGIARTT